MTVPDVTSEMELLDTIQLLQQELAQTNCDVMMLTLDLEQRVDERTGELRATQEELQRTNAELMHLTIELEDRVAQRTSELEQSNRTLCLNLSERKVLEDQLRQSQKLESIGQLAGGVAHDFNNLLTVIIGYSEMILGGLPAGHPLHEPCQEIFSAAGRAAALTRQLLVFSRRQTLEPKPIVINDLVRNTEKMLRRLIGEDIELILALDPDSGVLRADPGQIEQVVVNLAVNARDAMPRGGRIVIETGRLFADQEFSHLHLEVPPGLYVLLSISDTGVGMTPEIRDRVFEPFFTTKEPGKGTGLGLSTVYGIVKQSGGSISIYSEPGRGSSFKMLFPAIDAEEGQAPVAPAPVSCSKNETILLVEDEVGVRKFIRRVLERHGYCILEAPNGVAALTMLRAHSGSVDLLLTDVVMPGLGGPELAQQVESLRPGMPVLYMSGYNDGIWRTDENPRHFIQKPFPAAALLAGVQEVLTPGSDLDNSLKQLGLLTARQLM